MKREDICNKVNFWRANKKEAVINSSPSIYLSKICALNLLNVYSKVYMPYLVKIEVIDKGKLIGARDVEDIEDMINNGMISVESPSEDSINLIKSQSIHTADIHAIALAIERNSVLIMDDRKAVEVAKNVGIIVEPTLTVILKAFAVDLCTKTQAKNYIRRLMLTEFRLSEREYKRALEFLEMVSQC